MSLRTAASDSDCEVIGTTKIGLLDSIAVVYDNVFVDNIISIAKLDQSGFIITFGNNDYY